MRWLAVVVALPVLVGFVLGFRSQPRESPLAATRPVPADEPAPKPELRQAAHEAATPEASAQGVNALLEAAIALRCGTQLQEEAKRHSGETAQALLELAAQHFQTCLTHEGQAVATLSLFADARRNLDQTRALLASKPAPKVAAPPAPVRPEMLPKPREDAHPGEAKSAPPPKAAVTEEKRQPPAPPAPKKARPNKLMVGPDGVIYERKD
jgi:hypothetical protein